MNNSREPKNLNSLSRRNRYLKVSLLWLVTWYWMSKTWSSIFSTLRTEIMTHLIFSEIVRLALMFYQLTKAKSMVNSTCSILLYGCSFFNSYTILYQYHRALPLLNWYANIDTVSKVSNHLLDKFPNYLAAVCHCIFSVLLLRWTWRVCQEEEL